jgi:acetate---CoA ligase (ADP-forming)
MGFPVVLKVVSPDILHKSEVGGVKVNLTDAQEVQDAFLTMSQRLHREAAEARIEGYSVQAMAGDGPEILLGARFDPVFGPLVLLGSGGTWVEILRDVKVYLTPLDRQAALDAVAEMTLAEVFKGARGEAPYDLGAIADCIVNFSRLVADLHGRATEVELNPVRITRDRGPIAVDALIVLERQDGSSQNSTDADVEGAVQWANA